MGGDFSDGYFNFAAVAWDGGSGDLRSLLFAATTAAGAPRSADRVTAWSGMPAGPGVLLVSAVGFAKNGEDYLPARAGGPSGSPLHLRAVGYQDVGELTFTPDANGWTRIGAGNGALDWARGTFAHTIAPAGRSAIVHVTDRRPSGVEVGILPSGIVHPPWARWDELEGHVADRLFDRAAAVPTDNLWDGDVRAAMGVHSNAAGALTDLNIYSNWGDIAAGRRILWFSKYTWPAGQREVAAAQQTITPAMVQAFRVIRPISHGSGALLLSNPGNVAEAGAGNAAYLACPFDVALDGTLSGLGVELVAHAVRPADRTVRTLLADVIGSENLVRLARPWLAGRAYRASLDLVINSGNVYLCKANNSDAAFAAAK